MRASLHLPLELFLGKGLIQSQPHKAALESWGWGRGRGSPAHHIQTGSSTFPTVKRGTWGAHSCTSHEERLSLQAQGWVGAAEGGDGMFLKEHERKEAHGWGRFSGYEMCINSWEVI